MKKAFTKMHGCGNDYIYFNCFEEEIKNPEELSIRLSDRHFGVGGDGIIMICPSPIADGKMRIFNADGSEAKMCGNGIRCVGKYLYDNKMVTKEAFTVDTLSGIKYLKVNAKDGIVETVQVDMGAPILVPKDIPVLLEGETAIKKEVTIDETQYEITCVSMGNPHCVVFVEDTESLELEKIGPKFEKNPLFPEQVNTEFIKVIDEKTLEMRVWERGSGETWACGTGACAAAVAAVLNGYCKKNEDILVHLKGGDLVIRYTDETVYMTGEAVKAFEGVVEA
jgi:diaminopimelate epimerase